jgi:hypothetical protein
MKRSMLAILLMTLAAAYAQNGKTVKVSKNDIVVIEKLPISLVVGGDTLVLGDLGVQDAGKKMHMTWLGKEDRVLRHLSGDDKDLHVFTINDDDKGEKKVHVRIIKDDDKKADAGESKTVTVTVSDQDIDLDKEHKNVRVFVTTDKDDDEKVIVHKEVKGFALDDKDADIVIVQKMDKDGDQEIKQEKKIVLKSDDKTLRPIIGLGILLSDKEGKLVVDKILEPLAPKDQPFQEKDQILKLNGKEIKAMKDFTPMYEKLETNQQVKVLIKRDGKEKEVSFNKPEEKGNIMIMKSEKK